jgi:hypothetical protein
MTRFPNQKYHLWNSSLILLRKGQGHPQAFADRASKYPMDSSKYNIKLKRLRYHHLDLEVFFRYCGIDAGHNTFCPCPDSHSQAPFHIGMQRFDVPAGEHPPDLREGDELQPPDADIFLNPIPALERIPAGNQPDFSQIVSDSYQTKFTSNLF